MLGADRCIRESASSKSTLFLKKRSSAALSVAEDEHAWLASRTCQKSVAPSIIADRPASRPIWARCEIGLPVSAHKK